MQATVAVARDAVRGSVANQSTTHERSNQALRAADSLGRAAASAVLNASHGGLSGASGLAGRHRSGAGQSACPDSDVGVFGPAAAVDGPALRRFVRPHG